MKYINYILILTGAVIAMYGKSTQEENQYFLIIGIILIILGVYRIARTIPSKTDQDGEQLDKNS